MKIKFLGHACFLITSDAGIKIITDPYNTGDWKLSYGEINESADILTISHEHFDHNNIATIMGIPEIVRKNSVVSGIIIKAIPTKHDSSGGSIKGNNTIFSFQVDGVTICHMGDLGHLLNLEQLNDLNMVHILLIPVGGLVTIDAQNASDLCEQIKPKIIIPMHYKTPKCGLPLANVEEFLRGKKNVKLLGSSELEINIGKIPPETQILVLESAR